MKIEIIDSLEAFEGVRVPWEEVNACDPAGGVFTSWAWFRGWLSCTPYPWRILALRRGGAYLAFLPLGQRERTRRGVRITELYLGGYPSSDHAGFLCRPECRGEGVAALADALMKVDEWSILRLLDVFDPKVEDLVSIFAERRYEIIPGVGQACPYIPLPPTWEEYLKGFISHGTRKKFRRFVREHERREEFRVELATAERFEAGLAILLEFFQRRWPDVARRSLEMKRQLLCNCFAADQLLLPVLYYQERPIAASAAFVDRKSATLADYNGGWDEDFRHLSPGNRLQCYLINYAIRHGFRCFDFLRGAEEYKERNFGALLRYNRNFVVQRKDLKRYWEKGLDLLQGLRPSPLEAGTPLT